MYSVGAGLAASLVVLEDVGDFAQVELQRLEVVLHIFEALNVLLHFLVGGVGDEHEAIHAAQDELAGGVVDHLPGDGVELELGLVALDGDRLQGEEVEEQRAVRAGGQ